jgi:hypothetical protein
MPHSNIALIALTDEGATGQVEYFWKVGANGKIASESTLVLIL